MANDQLFCVGQKAIIVKDGKVLVLHDPLMGDDIPGGKVQEGETDFEKALEREVMEETGLTVNIGAPFAVGYFEFKKDSKHRNAGKKIYLVIFKCQYVSGEIQLSDEHDGYMWVTKNDYKEKVTKKWDRDILTKYFSTDLS